jgi:hypothetical protein
MKIFYPEKIGKNCNRKLNDGTLLQHEQRFMAHWKQINKSSFQQVNHDFRVKPFNIYYYIISVGQKKVFNQLFV